MLTSPQDSTKFIKSQDVMAIYNSVVKQGEFATLFAPEEVLQTDSSVTKLNSIRDEQSAYHSSLANGAGPSNPAPHEPNRVDTILSDVFGLLSLFFLTIGKSRETPATYAQIASMRVGLLSASRLLGALDGANGTSKLCCS